MRKLLSTVAPPRYHRPSGKGHGTGKWRLITDLSYSSSSSVNDGIDLSHCLLRYTSVEEVAEAAAHLGRGTLLAKVDIEAAYRLMSVHPDDCWLPHAPLRASLVGKDFQRRRRRCGVEAEGDRRTLCLPLPGRLNGPGCPRDRRVRQSSE